MLFTTSIFILNTFVPRNGYVNNRGGVEDTRLEAKAKDTKKNPRPRTALPRTDPTEAKDRNAQGQGSRTQALVLFPPKKVLRKNFQAISEKKVFRKNFRAISRKNRLPNNFSGAPQTFNYTKNSAVLEPRTGQFSKT